MTCELSFERSFSGEFVLDLVSLDVQRFEVFFLVQLKPWHLKRNGLLGG